MVTTTFLVTLFLFSSIYAGNVSGATLTRPDPARNLIQDIDLWVKYKYNETAANAAVIPIGGSYSVLGDIAQVNTTAENDFASASDAIETGEIDDLNVSVGVKMSVDYVNDLIVKPSLYVAPATTYTTMMRKISAYSESDLAFFGDDEDLQYYSFESATLEETQEDLAEAVGGRSWNATNVNMTQSLIRITYNYDLVKEIIDGMIADATWDADDPISDAKMRDLIEVYLGPYQRGLFFGIGNYTELREDTDKSDWDLNTEITATLDNTTDSTLSSFTANSGFMGLALFSYIGEYGVTPTAAAMIASGNFGPLNAPDRGILKGLEMSMSADGVTQISSFIDISSYAIVTATNDFLAGARVIFSNIVPYVEFMDVVADGVDDITTSEWFAIVVLAMLTYFVVAYIMGGGKWKGEKKNEGYLGKLTDGKKRGKQFFGTKYDWQMLLVPIAVVLVVIVQLMAYYN